MKKPLVKTFGVYIVVEAEDDSCWKKCLSRLYSSRHVYPTAAKQKKVHPSRFLGRNINVSVNVMYGISLAPDGRNVKIDHFNMVKFYLSKVKLKNLLANSWQWCGVALGVYRARKLCKPCVSKSTCFTHGVFI